MMTGIAIIGLFYKPGGRVLRTVGWTSIFPFTCSTTTFFISSVADFRMVNLSTEN